MFLTDVLVILAVFLFIAAVAIELRKDRDKKMYVGREAKTRQSSGEAAIDTERKLPTVQSEASPPVVTQEEYKGPRPAKSA
jgi:hypothetical protein